MVKNRLIISAIVLNMFSLSAFCWENPIKKYDLYADTHNDQIKSINSGNYEKGMTDFYNNRSMTPSTSAAPSSSSSNEGGEEKRRRNVVLRESSTHTYSDASTPGWNEHDLFFEKPSLASIKEKYKRSNFTGCMQEAEAYVQKYPKDALGFYYLAMAYSKVGDQQNAIKAYEKVISINPNPMLVKYATNGRNCVLQNSNEMCYEKVNEPDLVYPHINDTNSLDLTPIDPQTLIDRNIKQLEEKLAPVTNAVTNGNGNPIGGNNQNGQGNGGNNSINLPFGTQDEKLDEFIKAPYGNGLSPELDKEYKQLQLKKLQQSINATPESPEKDFNNVEDIKKFDNEKSDADTYKIAYDSSNDLYSNSEYIQYKKEYDELRMLLGESETKKNDDFIDVLMGQEKKLTPEMIEAMMLRDTMSSFNVNELL